MNKTLEILDGNKKYIELIDKLDKKPLVMGLTDSQKIHFAKWISEKTGKSLLIITNNDYRAQEVVEDMKYFENTDLSYFPAKNLLFFIADASSKNVLNKRAEVLKKLVANKPVTVVMSVESLMEKMLRKEDYEKAIVEIKLGDTYELDVLIDNINLLGYERVDAVEARGQYSVKGGVLDIYSLGQEHPTRIEFWDDEVDSIRYFDLDTQRSLEKLEKSKIIPAKEFFIENASTDKLREDFESQKSLLKTKGLEESAENLEGKFERLIDCIENKQKIDHPEAYINYLYENPSNILDYFGEDYIICIDEPIKLERKYHASYKEFEDSIKLRIERGTMLPMQSNMIFSYEEIMSKLNKRENVKFAMLDEGIKTGFKLDVKSKSIINFNKQFDILEEELKHYVKEKYKILLLAGNENRGLRFEKELNDKNILSVYKNHIEIPLHEGIVTIHHGSFKKGFEYVDEKFVVISDREFFGDENKKVKRAKYTGGKKIENFTELKLNDYVVHVNHGIGVYRGIERMTVNSIIKDYLKIEYAKGGALFIPTTQMDNIQKYIGSEGAAPKLTKLGGADWVKTKAKAKAAIEDMAKELIELYAQRENVKGFKYTDDSVWQKEFESMFIYDETEDQLLAIDEVKEDMESEKVMDRLVCGDVGYGKTEVAIRAAFKAVQDNKQVAYLVPTTILAQQHYNTFVERMSSFPINIETVSRFKTKKEQEQILRRLERGDVDILIGTHRILSKDVKYKDLGLLIIDEEQRFGVAQKEKLKQFKDEVDAISLTATPIPRTLHMSLSGIRDISILKQPPKERMPIQTFVLEKDDLIIKEAIYRELAREGQVFYLYNQVKDIVEFANKVNELVPEARIVVAHGQMSKSELEKIMVDFVNKEYDVLVCTTIIETGIDIQNVNTMIIENADRMGLSQLYQIRGRVGRSNRLAYAYLTYKKDKILNEDAEKRLHAIKEFTEFGSGFKIAMRDLEIRGAGNLVGKQQHGHMETIGYELYCKLLEEAVMLKKGIKVRPKFETSVEVEVNAYIPREYIGDEVQKLEMYKKISNIRNAEDYNDIWEEIEDRFGTLTKPVQNLLAVSLIKAEANEIGITDIMQTGNEIEFKFLKDAPIDIDKLKKFMDKFSGKMHLEISEQPKVIYRPWELNRKDIIDKMKVLVKEFKMLKKEEK
ncbi:MAG: transcription-repair coupling factor [Clostridia bacterium]|jgi:transcription-repair coupling factor (superfamily II helicase)|nr:transcription-repair coupling factor [Clostridia bacterium]